VPFPSPVIPSLLRLALLAAVAFAAAPAPARAAAAAEDRPAPRGVALSSWRCEAGFCFAFQPRAERRPEAEILADPGALRSTEEVIAAIGRLPPGEPLEWYVPFFETKMAWPPAETVASIRRAAMARGVHFYGPDGPVEEAEGFPVPARKAAYGKPTYYLDHKWVELPDFRFRYLGTGALGESPPHAIYQEFEVARGETVQKVRTDPNFGNWTATDFDFAGKSYVFEVGTSEILRTGWSNGDLWAWTAKEYRKRLAALYGTSPR
jgi:hypothetical protein